MATNTIPGSVEHADQQRIPVERCHLLVGMCLCLCTVAAIHATMYTTSPSKFEGPWTIPTHLISHGSLSIFLNCGPPRMTAVCFSYKQLLFISIRMIKHSIHSQIVLEREWRRCLSQNEKNMYNNLHPHSIQYKWTIFYKTIVTNNITLLTELSRP